MINGKRINLYKYNLEKTFDFKIEKMKRNLILTKLLNTEINDHKDLFELSEKLYEKAFNALDICTYIEKTHEENKDKYKLFLTFQKIKREFRNEKILILFLLNYLYFRSDDTLENISFM